MKGDWLNTTKITNKDVEKPCVKLSYCPYGQLVEEYPILRDSKYSCRIENGSIINFGHNCPVHYLAEFVK